MQLGSPSNSRSIPRPALEKMELPSTALLVAPELCTQIPAKKAVHCGAPPPLKAMMLRALGSVPPTVLSGPLMVIPPELPNGCVPVISAPMILPSMRLPELPVPRITPVLPLLPEIKFPGGVPGVVVSPPMTLLAVPLTSTPTFGLPKATVPVTSVPMKLPCTVLDPPNRSTPRLLVEMMLRAATIAPPTTLFEPQTKTPRSEFPRASVPVISVPMRLPCAIFRVPVKNWTPSPMFPEIRLRAAGVMPPTVLFDAVPLRITPPCP